MHLIVATAILHNIAIEMNEEIPNEWDADLNIHDNVEAVANNDNGGIGMRRLIITQHFNNLYVHLIGIFA